MQTQREKFLLEKFNQLCSAAIENKYIHKNKNSLVFQAKGSTKSIIFTYIDENNWSIVKGGQ